MRCCSTNCKKSSECGLHYFNSFGTHQIEDFSSFGSGSISSEGCWADYWCGSLGDYKMFQPIQFTEEEFVVKHCRVCGHRFCGGIGTPSFVDCRFKEHLKGD
jgi:hypothetical protein